MDFILGAIVFFLGVITGVSITKTNKNSSEE